MRIALSDEEFQYIMAKVCRIPTFLGWTLKVERPLKKRIINVQAIRVYLPELRKEIDQTVESNENPRLLIKRTKRRKTGKPEIEIVFLGAMRERHVEDLAYYQKNPDDWITWGLIALTPEEADSLHNALHELFGITTLD